MTIRIFRACLTIILAMLGSLPAYAKTVVFEVGDQMGRDVVSFNSDAPIELIVGRTNKITGKVSIDDSLGLRGDALSAEFKVDLASIDTGIEMRNQHMRDNFLETSQFPTAIFRLTGLNGTATRLKSGQKVRLMASGEFSVHGKTVTKTVPVDVTYFPPCPEEKRKSQACDALTLRATFPVKLDEHAIKRPEMVFQKLADTVFVTVSATAKKKEVH